MTSPLGAVSQNHEEKLIESLEPNKSRYALGSKAAANPVSKRSGAVKVRKMLEQQKADWFFLKEFALAIVDGSHRCSCFQKLADFGELATERASQLTRMTLTAALGSHSLTSQELLELS